VRGEQLRTLCTEAARLRERNQELRNERRRGREAMAAGRGPVAT
jgi:hypothetical protein